MADLKYADLVSERTVTTGTDPIILSGAVEGARSFSSALSEGDRFYYVIEAAPRDDDLFELGIGTLVDGAIERAAIVSSDGNRALNLPAGEKTISLTVAAEFYARVQAHDVFAAWRALPGNGGCSVADFLAATLNQGTGDFVGRSLKIAVNPPETIDTGAVQSFLTLDTPSRSEGGVASSVRFALSYAYHPYAAGAQGEGQPAYTNNVVGLGWNVTPSWTLIKPTMGGPSIRVEARFKIKSREPGKTSNWLDGSEFHHAIQTVDGGERRPISVFAPHSNAEWGYNSDVRVMGSAIDLFDGYDDSQIHHGWRGARYGLRPIYYADKTSINHAGNNFAFLTQMNAAKSAYIPLPYVNTTDSYRLSRDIFCVVNTPKTNAYGIQSLMTLVGEAGVEAEARLIFATCTNSVTGHLFGALIRASVTQSFEGVRVQNTHDTGHAGVQVAAKGNSYLGFEDAGNNRHFGLRLKSSGSFVIGTQYRGGEHGSGDAIRINVSSLQSEFVKPPKLPSGSLTAAGSAATMGAGALAYVNDLTETTAGNVAAGGGAQKGVVVSDGASWRIMSAW